PLAALRMAGPAGLGHRQVDALDDGPVDPAVVPHTGEPTQDRPDQGDEQGNDQRDDAAGGEGALVQGDARQDVQAAQDIELAAGDGPDAGQDQRDDDRPDPDGHALADAVEPGHPPGHVAAAEVGDEQDDRQRDATGNAHALDVLAGLVGQVVCIGSGGQPDAGARGG